MSDITSTIAVAIKNHLPEQLGSELKKELDELASLRLRFASLGAEHNAAQAKIAEFSDKVYKLSKDLAAHGKLQERESAVQLRELRQDFRDLEVKMANQRHTEMLGLVGMVFKSPTFVKTVQGSVPLPVEGSPPNQYNSCGTAGTVLNGNVSTTETISQT